MCGICGKLNFDIDQVVTAGELKAMADSIRHRGPDDDGYYLAGPIGLGFRRLAIIDLKTGHQPLANEDNSIWIVFNGEIYNYQELRSDLQSKGHTFKTQTDTEVIVHLYEEFGEACVTKLRGMFAFAIWDNRQRTLLLARDRIGIKPLYYRLNPDGIIFGSEVKAILASPNVKAEIEPWIIDRFLAFDYLPGTETLFKGIQKLAPGYLMIVRDGKAQIKQYWDLNFARASFTLPEAEKRLLEILEESVRLHMISDVPVGFLLSGGLDSTAMLALAAGKTDHQVSTFTIGFSGEGMIDERPFARLAAKSYGSIHHELSISPKDFQDFLPKYVWHMEDPVCEPPAVALYYISKLAKDFVKVLISGEGGDEAFAGYPNYRNIKWFERFKSILGPARAGLPAGLSAIGHLLHSDRLEKYVPIASSNFRSYYLGRTYTQSRIFNFKPQMLYSPALRSATQRSESLAASRQFLGTESNGINGDLVNRMLYVDSKSWLPDDLLVKADKITMANSVELRVPFLDHKLLEFAASLPGDYKVHRFQTKYVAKRALSDIVPTQILERKKAGFPVPYASWMRKELKGWFDDLLLDRKTLSRGYFQTGAVENLLKQNTETGIFSKEIFSLAVLELWHRSFLN
jgi:asparagine synthase (glutamine-hydrolysing)